MYETEESFCVSASNHVSRVENLLLDHEAVVSVTTSCLPQGRVVLVDDLLHFSDFYHWVQEGGYIGHLDDLSGDRSPSWCGVLFSVVVRQEIAECLCMLNAILVYPYLLGVLVRLHQRLQEGLLEVHRACEALVVGANGGLECDDIEHQPFALQHASNQTAETGFSAARQQNDKRILLLHAEFNKLDDLFVPPPVPCAGLLFGESFSCRGEDARVVPPSAVDKSIGVR